MKTTLFALALVCLAAASRAAEAEYDYEEEAVPAAPAPGKAATAAKPGKLGGLLSPRSRGAGPLAARKSPAGPAAVTAKSTTTTEEPVEQAEEEYDEGVDEAAKPDAATTTTTSTEAPKKLGRGGVVRPFRSNEDLLAALKRRRAQGITSSPPKETSTAPSPTDAAQSKSKSSPRSKSGSNANEVPKSTSRVRFGAAARGKTSAPTAAQEEAQETRSEDVQVKPKSFRRG